MFAIVIIGSKLFIWVLRKKAPFYNGADLTVCVENSGVLEDSKDVNACVDKNNNNLQKNCVDRKQHAYLIDYWVEVGREIKNQRAKIKTTE